MHYVPAEDILKRFSRIYRSKISAVGLWVGVAGDRRPSGVHGPRKNCQVYLQWDKRDISSSFFFLITTEQLIYATVFYHPSLSMHIVLLFHLTIDGHHRAVMMYQVPPLLVKFKDVSRVERPTVHVDKSFHGDPSHVWLNPDPNISNMEVDHQIPIECLLPTMYYSIVTAKGK